jgi:hypothetical protein
VIAGPQAFPFGVGNDDVEMLNTGTGVDLSAVAENVAYTATGCPLSSGTDGSLSTNGPISIPGITVS